MLALLTLNGQNSQMMPGHGLQPMLGASLSWSVNKDFRLENHEHGDANRIVTFTLRSAFRMAKTCNYTLSESVTCAVPPSFETNGSDMKDSEVPSLLTDSPVSGASNDTVPSSTPTSPSAAKNAMNAVRTSDQALRGIGVSDMWRA